MPTLDPSGSSWRIRSRLWDYSWLQFFNGSTWVLTPGTDFPFGETDVMRHRAYYLAKNMGVKIRTQVNKDGTLVIQAVGEIPL